MIFVLSMIDSLLAPYSTLNSRGVSVSSILAERVSPIREDTRRWVYARNVPEGRLRVVFAGNTTGWHRNGIMKELLVEW